MIGKTVKFKYNSKTYTGLILDKILLRPDYSNVCIDHYLIQCDKFDMLISTPCYKILQLC